MHTRERPAELGLLTPAAALGWVVDAGERRLARRRRRQEAAADVAGLAAAFAPVGVLIYGTVIEDWSVVRMLAVTVLIGVPAGVAAFALLWFAGQPGRGEDIIGLGVRAVGGVEHLPACLGVDNRFPLITAMRERHLADEGLSAVERETVRVLTLEGYTGSLGELLRTARQLNRS